ncbi:MAG: glycosyltransferase [Phycisphaeraceae bacterium]|nr:glycosyltransferase [Phycisphaeraceae bacterium]
MMNVLHLAGPQVLDSPPLTALLADSLGVLEPDSRAQLLFCGGRWEQDRLRAIGARADRAAHPRFGRWPSVWASLGRCLRETDRPDLIHAWSLSELSLAALRAPRIGRVLTLHQPLSTRAGHWLRWLIAEAPGRTTILAISATLKRQASAVGIDPDAITVLRPGLDLGRLALTQRDQTRRELGLEPRDRLVAAIADPLGMCPIDLAATAICLAQPQPQPPEHSPRLRLLLDSENPLALRTLRLLEGLNRPQTACSAPFQDRFFQLLPACDFVLALGPQGGGLTLIHAMGANAAIVGEADYASAELLEDRHSALLGKPGDRPGVIRRLGRLLGDKHLAWQLRDQARHEAFSFFSRQRYRASLATVYRQMHAGQSVEVPAMEPTGGLRFTGRA